MDELIIGEKKYISSKQAAKETGYAKDYIGQLCREGRVPARLVGRSWYVLESAIQDHRFGEEKTAKEREQAVEPVPTLSPTWGAPRYEASPVEEISMINRLTDDMPADAAPDPVAQHLQDTWRAWFDRVADAAPTSEAPTQPVGAESVGEIEQKKEEAEEKEEEKEVQIPVHAIHHELPAELLPRHIRNRVVAPEPLAVEEAPRRSRRGYLLSVQVAGALIAVIVAGLAAVGSGYFDTYIISNSQARIMAGVSLYNK